MCAKVKVDLAVTAGLCSLLCSSVWKCGSLFFYTEWLGINFTGLQMYCMQSNFVRLGNVAQPDTVQYYKLFNDFVIRRF